MKCGCVRDLQGGGVGGVDSQVGGVVVGRDLDSSLSLTCVLSPRHRTSIN